jgi:CPA1 family monovalent cation:H+ antiporter
VQHTAIEILLLLILGIAVAAGARRLRLPYTLALVGAGIALGFVNPEELGSFELSADLLFTFLLPALLFEAAFHLRFQEFRANVVPIMVLALPGVLLSTAITSGALLLLLRGPSFGWEHALLFGAMISATDPVSVLSLFKSLGVDRRLNIIVEGESLLNDGVAVVLFLIVAAMFGVEVGHGGHVELHSASEVAVFGIRTFLWMAGGGVLVGGLVGALGSAFVRNVDDHLVEITVTTVLAYGSFLLAEQFHCSGVLSTVTAGIVTGSFGAEYGMSTRTRLAVEDFWEYAAFVTNTLVFLLVGVEIQIGPLVGDAWPILAAFGATLLGRAVAVYGSLLALRLLGRPLPLPWGHVMVWGGLRGGLSMVLVLGLPAEWPGRELLVHLVFGTVGASLFLQGLSIAPLVSRLRLGAEREASARKAELHRAELLGIASALHRLDELERRGEMSTATAEQVRAWYEGRRQGARDALSALVREREELHAQETLDVLLRLNEAEREAVRHALRMGSLDAESAEQALGVLDTRTFALKEALHHKDMSDAVQQVLATQDQATEASSDRPPSSP